MTVQIEVREETAARLQAIASALQLSLDDYLARIATLVPSPTPPSPLSDDPALTMAFRDYLSLSAADRRAMALNLQERYRDWLKQQLDLHRAAWIVVIGGQVVESSPRLDDYPIPERLMTLGTAYDRIPFVFSRPPLFEELSWSALSGDDFYPALALTIGAGDWEHAQLLAQGRDLIADFDTGSPYLFLSWDWLSSAGLVTATPVDFPQSWYHLGRQYVYYTRFLRVGIAAEDGTTRSLQVWRAAHREIVAALPPGANSPRGGSAMAGIASSTWTSRTPGFIPPPGSFARRSRRWALRPTRSKEQWLNREEPGKHNLVNFQPPFIPSVW